MEKIGEVVVILLTVSALALFMSFPIMWTWNYVMPYLFGLKVITWSQAWCLHFVCGSLIKSIHTHNGK